MFTSVLFYSHLEVLIMKNTIYLVTGAAGHLGSHIVSELVKQGNTVRAFILPSEAALVCPASPALTYITGDICCPDTLEPLFSIENSNPSKDIIMIHCAGLISIYGGKTPGVRAVNVDGTKNVVDACIRHGIKRLVYVSSVHAIPEAPQHAVISEIRTFSPEHVTGYYAKTKAEATQYVLDSTARGLDAVVVHPSGIIGPAERPAGSLLHMIANYTKKGMPLAVQGGYDFVDVRDVASGAIKAAQKGKSGECYILSNRFVSLKELFTELSAAAGQKKPRFFLPAWTAKCAAPFAQLHYKCWKKTPVFTPYALYTLTSNGNFSHEKASRELGYRPRPLRQTVTDMIRQITKHSGK